MRPRNAFYLGHIGPIPVYAEIWALLFLGLIFMVNQAGGAILGLLAVLAFVVSVVGHELGHALLAWQLRLRDIYIVLSAFGGYCSSLGGRTPKQQISISLAGPLVNFVFFGLAWSLLWWAGQAKISLSAELAVFLLYMQHWNLLLGIFNLMPIYPLDGGQAFLWWSMLRMPVAQARRATLIASCVGAFLALAFFYVYHGMDVERMRFSIMIVLFLLVNAFTSLKD